LENSNSEWSIFRGAGQHVTVVSAEICWIDEPIGAGNEWSVYKWREKKSTLSRIVQQSCNSDRSKPHPTFALSVNSSIGLIWKEIDCRGFVSKEIILALDLPFLDAVCNFTLNGRPKGSKRIGS